jgi:hypothetical protein
MIVLSSTARPPELKSKVEWSAPPSPSDVEFKPNPETFYGKSPSHPFVAEPIAKRETDQL